MKIIIRIFSFTLLCLLPAAGYAQNNSDILTKENMKKLERITEYLGECSMVVKSMDRLECFDDIIERFNITEPTDLSDIKTPLDIGKWTIKEDVSDIDGNHVIFMTLEPENSIMLSLVKSRPELVIRCIANSPEYTGSVYIVWDRVMGRAGKLYVKMRMDREMPVGSYWSLSSDNKGSFHPEPFELIKEMIHHSVIRIDAQDRGNKMLQTIIYDIRGFDNVIRTVRDKCNWA